LSELGINESVQLVWAMANSEAWLAGSARIEPVHFLLASLTIIDGLFDDPAEALDFNQESISSVFKIASECRSKMKMTDDEITSARRGIRKTLRKQREGAHDLGLLHRTAESRFMFQRAGRRARKLGASELTLFHLFLEILENLPAEARPFFPSRSERVDASSDDWPDYIGGVS
jgi:hypothetical protein